LQGRLYHLPAAELERRVADLLDLPIFGRCRPAGGQLLADARLGSGTGSPPARSAFGRTDHWAIHRRASLWKYLERLNREAA
jgi:hypothetical protein